MKCPKCNGQRYKAPDVPCGRCDGKGVCEPLTNEEWFNTLSTKEKAEWLDKVAENCCQICDEENRELCRGNIAIGCKFENAKKWELWLKQPHNKE